MVATQQTPSGHLLWNSCGFERAGRGPPGRAWDIYSHEAISLKLGYRLCRHLVRQPLPMTLSSGVNRSDLLSSLSVQERPARAQGLLGTLFVQSSPVGPEGTFAVYVLGKPKPRRRRAASLGREDRISDEGRAREAQDPRSKPAKDLGGHGSRVWTVSVGSWPGRRVPEALPAAEPRDRTAFSSSVGSRREAPTPGEPAAYSATPAQQGGSHGRGPRGHAQSLAAHTDHDWVGAGEAREG